MTRGGKYHGLIELYPLNIWVNSFAFPRMSFSVNFFVTKIIVFYIYRVNSAAVDFLMSSTASENRKKRSSRKRLSTVKSDDADVRVSGVDSLDSLPSNVFSVQRGGVC